MNRFRVGGAVRDTLLGYPHQEIDWVVVGSTPEEMTAAGYTQVGRDFPVFLHPDTKEEYALARTERKSGPGYHGFTVHADPSVTLEEDLERRDLTINAMAMDGDGVVTDPYGGQADLDAKILRHVSPHFVEDPLRVLRVARFAARYHYLGFVVAEETQRLMAEIVAAGELPHLSTERVWVETERALGEKNPEIYCQVLHDCGALQALMPEVAASNGISALIGSKRALIKKPFNPSQRHLDASTCRLDTHFGPSTTRQLTPETLMSGISHPSPVGYRCHNITCRDRLCSSRV